MTVLENFRNEQSGDFTVYLPAWFFTEEGQSKVSVLHKEEVPFSLDISYTGNSVHLV